MRPKQSASNTFSFEYHRQSNFLHSEIHPINKHVICSNSEKNKKVLHLRTWQFHCEMVGFCRFPKKSNHSPILIPFLFHSYSKISDSAPCARTAAPYRRRTRRLRLASSTSAGCLSAHIGLMGIQCVKMLFQWVSNGYPKMEDQSIPPSSLMILFFTAKHMFFERKNNCFLRPENLEKICLIFETSEICPGSLGNPLESRIYSHAGGIGHTSPHAPHFVAVMVLTTLLERQRREFAGHLNSESYYFLWHRLIPHSNYTNPWFSPYWPMVSEFSSAVFRKALPSLVDVTRPPGRAWQSARYMSTQKRTAS